MKSELLLTATLTLGSFFCPTTALAQGSLYLENLSAPPVGRDFIISYSGIAQSFITGTNHGGYQLNSVTLAFEQASPPYPGLTVWLYSANMAAPGAPITSLTGSANPALAGHYSYLASGVTLSPSTRYFVVLNAVANNGGMYWFPTASFFDYTSLDGWSTDRYYMDGFGSGWGIPPGNYGLDLQFAVNATVVPEPSGPAVLGLGGVIAALRFVLRRVMSKANGWFLRMSVSF